MESYPDVNVIAYIDHPVSSQVNSEVTKGLYLSYAKRMRDEVGNKLQVVMYNYKGDSEACINVKNSSDLVYWVAGLEAAAGINRSVTNILYDVNMTFLRNIHSLSLKMQSIMENLHFIKLEKM